MHVGLHFIFRVVALISLVTGYRNLVNLTGIKLRFIVRVKLSLLLNVFLDLLGKSMSVDKLLSLVLKQKIIKCRDLVILINLLLCMHQVSCKLLSKLCFLIAGSLTRHLLDKLFY